MITLGVKTVLSSAFSTGDYVTSAFDASDNLAVVFGARDTVVYARGGTVNSGTLSATFGTQVEIDGSFASNPSLIHSIRGCFVCAFTRYNATALETHTFSLSGTTITDHNGYTNTEDNGVFYSMLGSPTNTVVDLAYANTTSNLIRKYEVSIGSAPTYTITGGSFSTIVSGITTECYLLRETSGFEYSVYRDGSNRIIFETSHIIDTSITGIINAGHNSATNKYYVVYGKSGNITVATFNYLSGVVSNITINTLVSGGYSDIEECSILNSDNRLFVLWTKTGLSNLRVVKIETNGAITLLETKAIPVVLSSPDISIAPISKTLSITGVESGVGKVLYLTKYSFDNNNKIIIID